MVTTRAAIIQALLYNSACIISEYLLILFDEKFSDALP